MNAVQEAFYRVAKATRNLSDAVAEMKKVMDGYSPVCYWQAGAWEPEIRCYKHKNSSEFNEPCGGPPQSYND